MKPIDLNAEWLETDGLGGFASGTVSGIRTRRSHAILLAATKSGGVVLVNGFDAYVETAAGAFALSSQCYAPNVIEPDGATRIEFFHYEPWPRWRYRLTEELAIEQELFVLPGRSTVMLSWKLVGQEADATLWVRPYFSGRDVQSIQHENAASRFEPEHEGERYVWRRADSPSIIARTNGRFLPEPTWYRKFIYRDDEADGVDALEDLASPGVFEFPISQQAAVLIFEAEDSLDLNGTRAPDKGPIETRYLELRTAERQRRKGFLTPLHRAANAYLVRRNQQKTIAPGFPSPGDRARDTFISIRGLCLATGRLGEARDILLAWADAVSGGMLPNRLPDEGEQPEFDSVDASLWYVIAIGDYLQALDEQRQLVRDGHTEKLRQTIETILTAYHDGTRFGIRADGDGLLRAGEPGSALTWMNARVGGRAITPRIGKPVEVNALWLNAVAIGAVFSAQWKPIFEKGQAAFSERFWNQEGGYLYDVIGCDDQAGTTDSTFRPNQIFAIGGLPLVLLPVEKARRVVDAVEALLLTPMGLRSLAPHEDGYVGGSHQGTVWPWLIGPFVEAWLRVRDNSAEAKAEAAERFVMPLIEHLNHAGLGHISETAMADPPHKPSGSPFHACSLGELLRLDSVL